MKPHLLLFVLLIGGFSSPIVRAQSASTPATNAEAIAGPYSRFTGSRQFGEAQKSLEARLVKTKLKTEREHLQNVLADLHFDWARQLDSENKFQAAIAHYSQAYKIDNIRRRALAGAALDNIGLMYARLNQYEKAFSYYERATSLYREIKDRNGEANTLNNIGVVYRKLSQYQKALNYYNQALPIYHELKNRDGEANSLVNIGVVYDSLSHYQKALVYYNRALPVYREVKDRNGEANTLNNLGVAYANLSQFQKALSYYNQALPIRRTIKDRGGEATTLNNIGTVYRKIGNYRRALAYYNQALPIRREVRDRRNEALTLSNIGFSLSKINRPDEALRNYQLALSIYREVKYRQREAVVLERMMIWYHQQKQPESAILFGKQAVNVLQSIRSDNRGLDKELQTSYLEGNKHSYETLISLLIESGRLPEAEQVSRMLKQNETFDFVRRDGTQAGTTESLSLTPLEREYINRYDKLGVEAVKVGDRVAALEKIPDASRTVEQAAALEKLYNDREAIEGRFEIFRKELVAAFRAVTPDLNLVDVAASDAWQKALGKVSEQTGKKTALLTTVVAPEAFYVILTTSTARLRFSTPIKSGDLNALVTRFRSKLTDPNLDPQSEARQLWQVVFCNGELEAALQKADVKVALWSLGGSLRYVPIDALHDGETYLVGRERLNIVMTTVSKDYFEAPVGGRALGVGTSQAWNVQLKDGKGAVVETVPFSELTQVPNEVRGIIGDATAGGKGQLLGRILLEGDFNESQFQSQLRRGVRTVHVATHFRLRPGDSQKSFLLLGDGSPLPVFDWKVKMPLKHVELLTLSACETGLGGGAQQTSRQSEATGAEVGSLGEVAQLQGASSVIVSLWSVADSSTSLLMRDFYARWQQNPAKGKGEALRDAQRALLGIKSSIPDVGKQRGMTLITKDGIRDGKPALPFIKNTQYQYSHPYYWAPFTLVGNWR